MFFYYFELHSKLDWGGSFSIFIVSMMTDDIFKMLFLPRRSRDFSWRNNTNNDNTGGPLDMRILGLVKTRISGKSHIENQKAVIPYVHDFALICEKKKSHLQLFVYSLTTRCFMIYRATKVLNFLMINLA